MSSFLTRLMSGRRNPDERLLPESHNGASPDVSSEMIVPHVYTDLSFYGRITRQEAGAILEVNGQKDGLWLLRETITPMGSFSLSLVNKGT